MRLFPASLALGLAAALPSQNVFHGNGIPSAYIENTPAVVGQSATFRLGSPSAPGGLAVLAISGGLGPVLVPHPLIGLVGIDVLNPLFVTILCFLDANGDAAFSITLPPGVGSASSPPLFADALSVEAGPL